MHTHFFQGEKGMKSVIFMMLSKTGQAQKDRCLCGTSKVDLTDAESRRLREDAEGGTAHHYSKKRT